MYGNASDTATVTMLAAGGTLPLTGAGSVVWLFLLGILLVSIGLLVTRGAKLITAERVMRAPAFPAGRRVDNTGTK